MLTNFKMFLKHTIIIYTMITYVIYTYVICFQFPKKNSTAYAEAKSNLILSKLNGVFHITFSQRRTFECSQH